MKKSNQMFVILLIAVSQLVLAQHAEPAILSSPSSGVALVEQAPDLLEGRSRAGSSFSTCAVRGAGVSTGELPETSGSRAVRGKKSPLLAFTLSVFVPGLGQHYNGQYVKGIVQEVGVLLGALLIGAGNMEDPVTGDQDIPEMNIGIGICAAFAVWSIVDAPISAHGINRDLEQPHGDTSRFDGGKSLVELNAEPLRDGLGVKLSYHF